jgi:hypothetical protein
MMFDDCACGGRGPTCCIEVQTSRPVCVDCASKISADRWLRVWKGTNRAMCLAVQDVARVWGRDPVDRIQKHRLNGRSVVVLYKPPNRQNYKLNGPSCKRCCRSMIDRSADYCDMTCYAAAVMGVDVDVIQTKYQNMRRRPRKSVAPRGSVQLYPMFSI